MFIDCVSSNVPDDLILQLPFADSLGAGGVDVRVVVVGAVIRIDHGLLLIVVLDAQVGVKQHAQRAQEAVYISEEFCGLQQHHDDQRAVRQLSRLVGGAV